MKDPERFKATLGDPFTGHRLRAVTEDDIEADGASFMAFAAAMGVKVPKPKADEEPPLALPSS